MWNSLHRSCPSCCANLQHTHSANLRTTRKRHQARLNCIEMQFFLVETSEFFLGQYNTCKAVMLLKFKAFSGHPGKDAVVRVFASSELSCCTNLKGLGFTASRKRRSQVELQCNAQQFMLQRIAFQRVILSANANEEDATIPNQCHQIQILSSINHLYRNQKENVIDCRVFCTC